MTIEQLDVIEDETLEVVTEDEALDESKVEAEDSEPTEEEIQEESSEELNQEDEDEVIITLGDETESEEKKPEAPAWVKELRKSHREMVKRNKELESKLEAYETPKTVEVGAKPNLEDFDYDTTAYEEELSSWYDRKRKAELQSEEIENAKKAQQKQWQNQLDRYTEAKDQLKVKDFDEAESIVLETFDQTQQGMIIQGADNAALLFYALGKNPDKVHELAQITDPVKFAFTVAKLEKDLKVKNRKTPPPPPEKKVSGSAPKSGAVDKTLERLREEAEKTGNYTKVHKYRQQLKLKG